MFCIMTSLRTKLLLWWQKMLMNAYMYKLLYTEDVDDEKAFCACVLVSLHYLYCMYQK